MKHSLVILILLSYFVSLSCAGTCHVNDHQALLGFKSGITHDPARMLASWKPTTHCCKWKGVSCSDSNNRVDTINLADNYLTGTISSSLSNLTYLTTLYLVNLRNISGSFPEVLFHMPSLKDVRMDRNRLSGPLPPHIGNLTRLQVLSLASNQFSGPVPSSISKMRSLSNLILTDNLLSGHIPEGIGKLKNLIQLELSDNQISGNKLVGTIPPSVAHLPHNLYYFEVARNHLTGEIPSFFGKFQDLLKLDLSRNRFYGAIPKSFENMTMLGSLNVSHNNLMGPVPTMSNDRMSEIDLSYNKFNLGTVPEWISNGFTLNSVGLAKCGIRMRLDDWKPISITPYLSRLDISDNQISGSPMWLFNATTSLQQFRASRNKLEFNMGKLKKPELLNTLHLSTNLVFGKVPKSVAKIKNLDVSYNRLCGPIPENGHSASVFVGNDCLWISAASLRKSLVVVTIMMIQLYIVAFPFAL